MAKKASLRHRLYHGETSFDFMGRKRLWFAISAVIIALGLVSIITQGLNLGIDFKGGVAWTVRAPHTSVNSVRDAVRPLGLGEATIQTSGNGTVKVSFKHLTQAKQNQVTDAIAKAAHTSPGQVSINDVGPSWGKTVTNKARTALIVFFILITVYISFRFEWKMAIAALVAVVHDILVTIGVYSISRFEVTPATVVAFLTILGYSLYDTIVVFDRIEENTRGLSASGRLTYSDTVNLSMNQVLMRSINTSFVAILPVASILAIGVYVLGATALEDFGLALLVGLITGACSSICIASPVLVLLKEREPRYAAIRQRLATKGAPAAPLTPAAAAVMAGGGGGSRVMRASGGDGGGEGGVAEGGPPLVPGRPRTVPAHRPHGRQGGRPRPRKKRRR
ncbi:MAG: protein translocase subunit SecF [Actinobacteria bacterium]|nr:MAG: protein translocase subunit SecF [Actinomycetota bacterium]